MDTKSVIQSQFHASLAMFRQVVEKCPPELWDSPEYKNRFWNICAHGLIYTHLYLHPSLDDYKPWPEIDERARRFEPLENGEEKQLVSKQIVLQYLDFLVSQIDPMVARLNLDAESGFDWLPFNKLELQFYNIRHLMQHVGELAERLWQSVGIEISWIGRRE